MSLVTDSDNVHCIVFFYASICAFGSQGNDVNLKAVDFGHSTAYTGHVYSSYCIMHSAYLRLAHNQSELISVLIYCIPSVLYGYS